MAWLLKSYWRVGGWIARKYILFYIYSEHYFIQLAPTFPNSALNLCRSFLYTICSNLATLVSAILPKCFLSAATTSVLSQSTNSSYICNHCAAAPFICPSNRTYLSVSPTLHRSIRFSNILRKPSTLGPPVYTGRLFCKTRRSVWQLVPLTLTLPSTQDFPSPICYLIAGAIGAVGGNILGGNKEHWGGQFAGDLEWLAVVQKANGG